MLTTSMRLRAVLVALVLGASACGADATNEGAAETSATAANEEAMDGDVMDGDAMDMEDGDHGEDHGHGGGLEVPDSMTVPTVGLSAVEDPISGHNVLVDLTDFEISVDNASTDPVDGEGHLHLYVDGERVGRIYNTAIHLDGLEAGEHIVMIEVNANDHSAYTVDGEPIAAMATITVGEASNDSVAVSDIDGGNSTIAVNTTPDPRGGWNVELVVDGFNINGAGAGTAPVAGEGHVMVLVDGVELGRQYGANLHIPAMEGGDHVITAELRHNDTSPYLVDGSLVSASVTVTSPANESDSEATMIEATVLDGSVETESDRVELALGSMVQVVISSDVADEIHVHGYDEFADVSPGSDATIMFVADVPGVFEVELEGSGLFLFEIQVG